MTDIVLQDLTDGLLTISLNRPARKNALNVALSRELAAAVRRAATDTMVRAVLLRGEGGAFCAGGDIDDMADADAQPPTLEETRANLADSTESIRLLHEMPKPVVAAVRGACAGAGLGLALGCDLRIVGDNAKVLAAFVKMGLASDYLASYFATKAIGSSKARELFMLSPTLSGTEAHAIGLFHRVVPDSEVEEAARTLAVSLATGPTVAYGYIKANINNAETLGLDACFAAEVLYQARCTQTADHQEAARAFVEKRKPKFSGR